MSKDIEDLSYHMIKIISETNGVSFSDTLELAADSYTKSKNPKIYKSIQEFRRLLSGFQQDDVEIKTLFAHPMAIAMFNFFRSFPLQYHEEHIHLTGSLTAEFIYPRLKKLLDGPNKAIYEKKISDVYGSAVLPIKSVEDVDNLIRLKDHEEFDRYLEILLLPKLILTDRQTHRDAAYHMAEELFTNYNVGKVRLKFTFSRASANESDQIPGIEELTPDDVVMGLYDGFADFQKKVPDFEFVLSPSFRKESDFFDDKNFKDKEEHFLHQVEQMLDLIKRYPQLEKCLRNVDTVGNERDLYSKSHFAMMQRGFRKLHYKGFTLRSHHGETWRTLKKGVQAVDNAMNIWHINTLEHGLSLGINPNYYYHSLYQRVMMQNQAGIAIEKGSTAYAELDEMDWSYHPEVREKLFNGTPLTGEEATHFVKTKFHTAREVEHYQHDVLNRMLNKGVSLIALPTSNQRLTGSFPDHKDHPFSWWEKKGVSLGVGTDNYITLNTNYINELLILLFTDAQNLKITKLLMVATGENRRPFLSQLLWKMRRS